MSLPQLNKKIAPKDPVMNSSTTIKPKQEKVFRKAVLADFLNDTRTIVLVSFRKRKDIGFKKNLVKRNLLSRDERELKVNNYHRWGLLKKTEAIIK